MKYLSITEKIKEEQLILIPLGDAHIGSSEFNSRKFHDTINWIKSKPNARVILMGDMMDMGLRDSVGAGPYDNLMQPEAQVDYVVTALSPIKEKIWFSLNGNHSERVREKTGIDVDKSVARELNIPYVFGGAFVKAKINRATYTIFATHGSSGSVTPSGKLNALFKLGGYIQADLYLMGHMHDLMTHSSEYMKVNTKNKTIVFDKKHFVLTGHFLKYGGYAEKKCMSPGKSGVARVKLSGKGKDIHISI